MLLTDAQAEVLAYVKLRRQPCSWVRACLENDLMTAAAGDPQSQAMLCEFVGWLHAAIPWRVWGSREKVSRWLNNACEIYGLQRTAHDRQVL